MANSSYKSLKKWAEIEIIEKKSRFLGYAGPLEDPEAAVEKLEEIRALHPQATHHVSAWRFALETFYQRYSDDGEPQGTAGKPVLDVLVQEELSECGIIVVRYFGGIKLGAGGLVRTYSAAAATSVREAEVCQYERRSFYRLEAPYHLREQLWYKLDQLQSIQSSPDYGESVVWEFAPPPAAVEKAQMLIPELSCGTLTPELLDERYVVID